MTNYRLHPLYQRAREVGGQPIDWSHPTVARLQYEVRHDFTAQTPTINLIAMTAGVEDAEDLLVLLTDIVALPEQVLSYDDALGQGRN